MAQQQNTSVPWGPDNPHPLSRLKTELVWDGKYDEYGNRRPGSLPATPLPLQRIDTIDTPRFVRANLINHTTRWRGANRSGVLLTSNVCCGDETQLRDELRRAVKSLRQKPHALLGCLEEPGV